MPTTTTTLRLRKELKAEIERLARRCRRSFSEVTQDLLEEALRMRRCPGIHFADEPAGREAKIAGTGLAVWEVASVYTAVSGDDRALRKRFPSLNEAQLAAALLYYRQHSLEIDALVAENAEAALSVPAAETSRKRRGR